MEGLLTAGIPACPRPAREYQDRPVTPEVAGSSPVPPVKVAANRHLLLPCGAQLTAGFASSRADPARGSACNRRKEPAVAANPRRRMTGRGGRRSCRARSEERRVCRFLVIAPANCEGSRAHPASSLAVVASSRAASQPRALASATRAQSSSPWRRRAASCRRGRGSPRPDRRARPANRRPSVARSAYGIAGSGSGSPPASGRQASPSRRR